MRICTYKMCKTIEVLIYGIGMHTSKINVLRSSLNSKETLQNFLYLYKKKTQVVFFIFHFEQLSFFPLWMPWSMSMEFKLEHKTFILEVWARLSCKCDINGWFHYTFISMRFWPNRALRDKNWGAKRASLFRVLKEAKVGSRGTN